MTTRRKFLGLGTASLSAVSLRGLVPDLFAQAAAESATAGKNDHVLVVVELAGGNDGLNTVIPFEDALYYQNRPGLGMPKENVVRLSDQIGLHPRMATLGELFKQGRVAVVQGVGYPQPDRSHFRSMEIWHTASTATRPPATGWLGRYLDTTVKRVEGETFCGVCLSASLPQAFQAEKVVVPVTAQMEVLTGTGSDATARARLVRRLGTASGGGDATLGFLRGQAEVVYRAADSLKSAIERYKSGVEYPPGVLGPQLQRAAQIIAGRLGTRILWASQPGYDTHAYQADGQGALLEELSSSLLAFQQDLKALRLDHKVVTLIFSEFGRRVKENASAGTDHGAASCLFLVGSPVKGGLAGGRPSLEALDDGDLVFNTDFRSVYATVLEGWMGCAAEALLGGAFPKLDLLAAHA